MVIETGNPQPHGPRPSGMKPYLQPDGRWVVKVQLPATGDGRRGPRRSAYGRSSAEAESAARDIRDALARHETLDDMRTPLSDVLDRWHAAIEPGRRTHSKRAGITYSTWEQYEVFIRVSIKPYLGNIAVGKLTTARIQQWLDDDLPNQPAQGGRGGKKGTRRKTPLSARSLEYAWTTVKAALAWAVRQGVIGKNPADNAAPPSVPETEVEPFSLADAQAMVAAVTGDRLEALYILNIHLGPRQGETLSLALEDVDLAAGTVRFSQTLTWPKVLDPATGAWQQDPAGKYHRAPMLKANKTKHARRTISLPPLVIESFRRRLADRERERVAAGDRWEEFGLIFCSPTGRPIRGNGSTGATAHWSKLLAKAGLDHRRYHEGRHFATTSGLVATGGDKHAIQLMMGWASHAMIDRYGHLFDEGGAPLASKIGLLLGGPREGLGTQAGTQSDAGGPQDGAIPSDLSTFGPESFDPGI
jgi:integrase